MNYAYEANIIRALAIIVKNGNLQRGFKPVHWCVDCGSALAEAEVEYANKTSPAIDVRFRAVDENAFLARLALQPNNTGKGPISVPIWTTTPWTLPANEAVALNAKHDYVLMQIATEQGEERIVLAAGDLLQHALERYGVEKRHELTRFNGAVLEGLLLKHPFYDRQVPIVLGDHVTLDAGSGAVHTAPAHGQDDYQMGLQYHLPLINPVGNNGCYTAETPIFAGEHVFKANTHVIEILKEQGMLLSEKKLEHSYPHCWRHKTPLIFLATPQWFISMDKQQLRAHALASIKQVQWAPDWGQSRIASMIDQRPDWCISRQRTWGVPITLFVHKGTREPHPETLTLFEKVAQLVEKDGVDAWFDLDPATLLGDDAKNYDKLTDTLDVWFDSGTSHFAVLKHNPALAWPADLYLEGSDQHRGWFQSSLLTSNAMYATAPYKAVLTHGFTVDEKGRKMSKSLGNVVAPDKVISSLGADILRLWVSSTDYRGEIAVSDEILKRTAETYRRLRNTTRFLLANLHDFDPTQNSVPSEKLLALDAWIVERARLLQEDIKRAYDEYQFHVIYQKLHNFCVIDLGGFYLDIIKDRQYTTQKNSVARRSAQTALYYIAEAMVRWFAPILSFTAEEIWHYLPGQRSESVLLENWYVIPPVTPSFDSAYWEEIIRIRDAVNKELEKQRNAGIIGSALEAEVELYCSSAVYSLLEKLGNELRFVLITSSAKILADKSIPADAVTTAIHGLAVRISASANQKCVRCWHRRADVGSNKEHPEICGRCVENLPEGKGEIRHYA